jgi:hypothetical protein
LPNQEEGILLSIVFVLGIEMKHNNLNNNNNSYVKTAAIIFTLAIMIAAASSMPAAPVAAATTTTEAAEEETETTMPAPSPSSGGLELSPQPVYQEQSRELSATPINQTHIQFTFTGNGTLTLPNATETINTTSTGSVIVSLVKGTAIGQEVLSTVEEDGTEEENATTTFFGITRFDLEQDIGRAVIMSIYDTNSTGRLAPLDGMILVGQAEFPPGEISFLTLWEWQGSGIPLPTTATTTQEVPPLMNTTNSSTDAAADATAAPSSLPQVEQQQQEDDLGSITIIDRAGPPAPTPDDERTEQ